MAKDYKLQPNYATDLQRDSINRPLVDIIVAALEGLKSNLSDDVNKVGYKYILGQAMRQYLIPKENWHLTEAAKDLWDKITDENISWFTYREKFTPINSKGKIKTYKGNVKNNVDEVEIVCGKKLKFISLFICEHTTPISDMIEELCNLQTPNYNDVKNILEKIHITRMLRTEDRSLKVSRNRIKQLNLSAQQVDSKTLFVSLFNKYYKGCIDTITNVPITLAY